MSAQYSPLAVEQSSLSARKLSPRSLVVAIATAALLVVGIVVIAHTGGDTQRNAKIGGGHDAKTTMMPTWMPSGSCGDAISTYNQQTRTAISGIAPGTGFPVAGTFASVAPAVTFANTPRLTSGALNCDTHYTTTTSSTLISNSLNVGLALSGDTGTGESASGNNQFAYNDAGSHNSAYAMLTVRCNTPMLQATGASMTASGASSCENNYINFVNTEGQCFVSGITAASQLNIVIRTDASSVSEQSSNKAKLEGAMSATPEDPTSAKGSANISSSFSEALSGTTHSVTSYSFGLNNNNYNFAGITNVAQITDALRALPSSYQPQTVAVETAFYHNINSDCVIRQAGCLSAITAAYQQYNARLTQLVDGYQAAVNDPAQYSHTAWQIYIYVDLFHYQYHKQSAQNGACVPNPRGGCRNAQSGSNGGWRGYLTYFQGHQNTLHAWWADWNNDNRNQAMVCDAHTTFASIVKAQGLPDLTYLNNQLDFMPSSACPQSATLNSVNAVGLDKQVGGTYNGWYRAPALCCPGGMTLQARVNAIKCACSAPGGCSRCTCG